MRILSSYFLFALLILSSCSDDDATNPGTNLPTGETGQFELSFTDAPIDNAEVTACFVTITELQIDGVAVEGFQKTTIDLLSYQKGDVFSTGTVDLSTGTYGNISLVLDYDQDANGNSPGCYIAKTDGSKDKISSSSGQFTLAHNTSIETNKKTSVVADFDLRKAIYVHDENVGSSDYEMVNETDLTSAIRISIVGETGVVSGSVSGNSSADRVVVAYLYEQGNFNANTELSGQGSGNLMFKNAINSVKVDAQGTFELHFLEESTYDLYFASYTSNTNGRLEFEGLFSVNSLLNQLDPVEVTVTANTTATLDISLIGLVSL